MRHRALAILILGFTATTAQAASFTPLGDLPGGNVFSKASGISADGSVVVGEAGANGGVKAFRWTSVDGMQALEGLTGQAHAYAASADGSVIVGAVSTTGDAFRWTSATGMVSIGHLGGHLVAFANGVSADGSVVVGESSNLQSSGSRAFRWTSATGMVAISSGSSGASAVSADGSVIVGYYRPAVNQKEAAIWVDGSGPTGLGEFPGGLYSGEANAVSPDGTIVVGGSFSDSETSSNDAFTWTAGTGMVNIGDDRYETARGVSADGSVIVGGDFTTPGQEALIWTPDGPHNLVDVLIARGVSPAVLAGWSLEYATGVSADGTTVVGHGINPSGFTEAFVANVVPDVDNDGAQDSADNCTEVSNPDQFDADGEGYGNICDADLNNSGLVTSADYTILRNALNTNDPIADLNHSGMVTSADFTILRNRLNTAPGPSGLSCAGTSPCP